jgi:cell division septum initiation protein DivIVA
MGTIKELTDLITNLSCDITEKSFADELRKIKTLTIQIQAFQTDLVEKRIELMRENEDLKNKIDDLNQEINILKLTAVTSE